MSEGAISQGERGKVKSCDPEFKLFGRRIPVVYASESGDRSSDSTDSSSSEVTKIKSSSDDSKSSSDSLMKTSAGDEKASICGHRNEGEMSCDESRSSLENKFHMDDFENLKEKKLDGETHFQERGEKNIEMEEKGDDQKSGNNVAVREGSEESNKTEQGTPKKPNKVLPCPRCESMDTKFCYYNNYNVNQPRHFCRNCQRYWTAGGLLRNVPVGAGRRKNKHSAATVITHQRDLVSESRAMMGHGHALSDWPSGNSEDSMKFEVSDLQINGFRHDVKKGATRQSGAFVGLDENFQKSTCSSNQIRFEKGDKFWNTRWISKEKEEEETPGEFRAPDDTASVSVSASSNTKSVKSEMVESYESSNIAPKDQGGGYELPNNFMSWVNGPPPVWPLYCGSFFGNSSYMNGMGGAMLTPEALQASAMMPWFQPGTGLCPGFPWPFPSAPMWGQASWGPAWGMPLRPVVPSAAVLESTPSSSPAMLGKHTRDLSKPETESKGEGDGDGDGDGSLWVPKTLRIDDPEEAAKSSIWATLGLGSKPESITSGGIFKAFQPKTENNDNTRTAVHILCANPAASTRSATFNENA